MRSSATDNAAVVLDLVRSSGVISRVQLAAQSGLTEASVSRIVKQLIADGVVEETGRGASTGGKRPTLLQLNPAAHQAIGIYISDHRVRYVLTDLVGHTIAQRDMAGGMMQRTRKDLIADSGAVIDALLQAARVDRSSVFGVGIAVPGRQQITRPHPGLRSDESNESYEWAWDALERDFAGQTGMCISVENDSTCGALGEFWISRAPAESELAVVTIAGGIGFGLVTSGDVYRGATSNVGELGHVIVQADGPQCQCGSRGCLELYASPANIVGRALGDVDLTARLALAGDGDSLWADYERLAIAASLGDGGARDAVIEAAQMLAVALISITNILDLERIVLTGPALDHVGQLVAETVEAELRERAIARSAHPIEVRVSPSGRNAAAVGAATLVIHQQLGSARRSSRWRSRNVAREPAPTAPTTSTRIP